MGKFSMMRSGASPGAIYARSARISIRASAFSDSSSAVILLPRSRGSCQRAQRDD
jgi:hypothetical protein